MRSKKFESNDPFLEECETLENEINRMERDFKKLDTAFRHLNSQAQQGKYISSIIKFAVMIPDIISLIKRIPALERRVEELSARSD